MILIFAAGTFGLLNLKKRIWPIIEFDWITIEMGWPGASHWRWKKVSYCPGGKAAGIEGIEKVSSTASDGWANFGLETSSRTPMDRILDKVRQEVESAGLPEDADKPVIYQETEWNRVMLLFIYGPDDPSFLEDVAEEFREELLRTGEVTQINTWGFPQEKIILEPIPRP